MECHFRSIKNLMREKESGENVQNCTYSNSVMRQFVEAAVCLMKIMLN